MDLRDRLNDAQHAAVTHSDGPFLVIAGAGSGKTRVLTYRFAHLVRDRGVDPRAILAVTFTNKAAREMGERIRGAIAMPAGPVSIGTFHAFGARFLRREAAVAGLEPSFVIYDVDDQERLLRDAIHELALPPSAWTVSSLRARISDLKGRLLTPAESPLGRPGDEVVRRAYALYETRLRERNACDFDDLLLLPVRLLRDDPEVAARWRGRYTHLLIDEYQDTNGAQHELVRLLAAPPWNVCAVGDEDQSIYRWRGARIGNILDFEETFPGTALYRLEQNYRSTGRILAAANAVVSRNRKRRPKTLWTDREEGDPLFVRFAPTEVAEGRWIAHEVQSLIGRGRRPGDIALFYRTNAQSRALEEGLRRAGVPYVIVGGLRFYERREVKDLLAYARVLVNPRDELSLLRALGAPPRGVGEKSVERLRALALVRGVPMALALPHAGEIEGARAATQRALVELGDLLARLRARLASESAAAIVRDVIEETGFVEALRAEGGAEAAGRIENVEELVSGMEEYAERTGDASLGEYLTEVSLLTDIDAWDEGTGRVSLMTLHNAKGLEFPVAFITGLEEGLFPHPMSLESEDEEEEERRLFYVGLTRAKDRVYLTGASTRLRFGTRAETVRSRFVREIPPEHVDDGRARTLAAGLGARGAPAAAGGLDERNDLVWDAEPRFGDDGREEALRAGERVRHPVFGDGWVLQTSGRGDALKITVEFNGAGVRKLVAAYAALQRIG
jgi:DNA helicase-2/ATP-dependent DNA helicase PcrA